MTQPSSKVQQALCSAMLRLLKSPDLTPEDAEWLQRFAMRTLSEFSILKPTDKKDAPEDSAVT